MIGTPILCNACVGLGQCQFATVYLAPVGHDPGNDTEPTGNARVMRAAPDTPDQRRIQFVCASVEIKIGPRRIRCEQRRATGWGSGIKAIDKSIFRGTYLACVEDHATQERGRVIAAAMRRSKDNA